MVDAPDRCGMKDLSEEFQDDPKMAGDILRDQQHWRKQIGHIQDFLNTSGFVDLQDVSVSTSSSPDEIAERIEYLKYRLTILDALREIFAEELKFLEQTDTDTPEN